MKKLIVLAVLVALALSAYFLAPALGWRRRTADCIIRRAAGVPLDIPLDQLMVWQQQVQCTEAPDPAEFAVQVRVDPDDGKNRIYYTVTESHGYYADTLILKFWYKDAEDTPLEESPLVVDVKLNNYVTAAEPLHECTDVVWAELQSVGGDMGTTQNWAGRVDGYYRACAGNPDCFPNVIKATTCD